MNDPTPVAIIAHALEHLTDHLRTGSMMPAHRAAVLFECISRDTAADARLRELGVQLAQALCRHFAVFPRPRALTSAGSYREPSGR